MTPSSPPDSAPSPGLPDDPESARESAQVVQRAGIVAGFTLGSRVLGYARDAVLANLFGASSAYDAFVVAQTIPNFLRRLVAEGSLVIAFVPLLSKEKADHGLEGMRRFTSSVLGLLVPTLVVFSLAGMLFPEPLVTVFAPGFDPERAETARALTQIMMPYILFVSLVAVAGGALNVEGVFAAPAAAPIFLNLAIIAAALGFRERFDSPIEAVAWGVIVGGLLQLGLQLPALRRKGLLVRPRFEPRHPSVVLLGKRMLPALFGVAVYQINIMVIRQIGSFLPTGQLSCYYNATRLQEFALGVFAVSVSVAALPTLSDHAASEDWVKLKGTWRRALRATNFVTVPATLGLLALSGPIVAALFRHGQYSLEAARLTSELLVLLGLSIAPVGAIRVTVPVFYALGDTKTPVIAATVSLATTLILGFALKDRYEIQGLCAATSIAAAAQLLALWLMLRLALSRKMSQPIPRSLAGPSVMGHGLRCLLAAIPGCLLSWFLAGLHDWEQGRNLVDAGLLIPLVGIASLIYLALGRLLGLEEVGMILRLLGRRFRRFVPWGSQKT